MSKLFSLLFFFVPRAVTDQFAFELRSVFGRALSRPLRLDCDKEHYVNLGSGGAATPGFINADFFGTRNIDYASDFRYRLKIPSESISGVFSEHTIEHLSYEATSALFSECFRVMKKGAVIRIIAPDLSLFIENYANDNIQWFKLWEEMYFLNSRDPLRSCRQLLTPLQAISFVTQEYGHVSCWDYKTLLSYLELSGFSEVEKVSCMEGRDEKLLLDNEDISRKYVSVYVEAVK